MTHDLLKRKVLVECELYRFGMGTYRVYTFLMDELNDSKQVEEFMLNENYSPDEISKAKSDYKRYLAKSRTLVADRVF